MLTINRCARIKIVNTISVGFAWDRGNHTAHRGIIAIDTMRMKLRLHVMLRKNYGRRLLGKYFGFKLQFLSSMNKFNSDHSKISDICIIITVTWITCNHWNLSINCIIASKKRWKKCNNTICRGLKWVNSYIIRFSLILCRFVWN